MTPSRLPSFAALALAACALGWSVPAAAQSDVLLRARAGSPLTDRFRVDSSGSVVAFGLAKDGDPNQCAPQTTASGAGTRFMWLPCLGSLRFGRVPTGQTNWDNANMDFFTFAGGNQVTASGYGSFAFGDQVTASSTVGVGFGSGVTVSGTAGFSAGASNVCSGFACVALGYTVRAGGQGSVALGYRTTANNDYAVAIGYRASNNTHTGTMVMGDESTTDSVRNQADNEFRARYIGGFRLRVSAAANGNTPGAGGNVGCDLTPAVPTWTCASSRTLKTDYLSVDGEDVLRRVHDLPITTWTMTGGDHRVRHIGPVAEDFHRAFGMGLGPTTIGLGDIDGVNLAAAKALELRTARLQAQLDERTAEVAALRGVLDEALRRVGELDARLRAVEAARR
ncbi:MAG TPA: tail fiber domain-containing protein [Longimicrobium sp.]